MNSDNNNKFSDIDALLRGALKEDSLRDIFEKRVHELRTTQTAVQKLLDIERRTLNGILDGTLKKANYDKLRTLAEFLKMPVDKLYQMYVSLMEENMAYQNSPANKRKFIKERFDLTVLKKAGFINSLVDFEEIENKIVSYFGFSDIFEYEKRSFDAAFSDAVSETSRAISRPKTCTDTTRDFWLTSAKRTATLLDNPYQFNRQSLIEYFPKIRWHSTNVAFGLLNVIKVLFKLGVTVIYQSPFSSLHLRGATISVNNKPCIVLTDYKGFYPTLWHALIHELYHVLFDWEDIRKNNYLLSEDTNEIYKINEREVEADNFARDYMFSLDKLNEVKPYMLDHEYIEEVAKNNHVHPSIIYVYYAFENEGQDRKAWARARVKNADIKKAVFRFENHWDKPMPIETYVKKLKLEIYN